MPNWKSGPLTTRSDFGADDWDDDGPGTPSPRDQQQGLSPRRENFNDLEVKLLDGTILVFGFAVGYLFRSFLN